MSRREDESLISLNKTWDKMINAIFFISSGVIFSVYSHGSILFSLFFQTNIDVESLTNLISNNKENLTYMYLTLGLDKLQE